MAFHIQHAPKRNALLEGIVQGHGNAASEASQMRLLERKNALDQQAQAQQSSILQNLFGGGDGGGEGQNASNFLESMDPIQAAATIASLPIDKNAKGLLNKAIEIRRKEADIPLDVLSQEALKAHGFTEDDLTQGILLPEELKEVDELKRYLAKNAKSQKDIPKLTYEYLEDKNRKALENGIQEETSPKEALFAGIEEEKPKISSLAQRRIDKKLEIDKEKQRIAKETQQKSFDSIIHILNKGNIGRGSNFLPSALLGGQTAEDIAEFDSLVGAFEAALLKENSKGALTDKKFDYIINKLLPKATDTQAEIIGKLRATATKLGLDASKLGKVEKESPKKPEEKKSSNQEIKEGEIRRGFKYVGGDPHLKTSWEKVSS
jgi:hypothetical protein